MKRIANFEWYIETEDLVGNIQIAMKFSISEYSTEFLPSKLGIRGEGPSLRAWVERNEVCQKLVFWMDKLDHQIIIAYLLLLIILY